MSGQGLSWRELVEQLVEHTGYKWLVHVDWDVVYVNDAGGVERGESQEVLLATKDSIETLYFYRYLPWETGQSRVAEDRERIQQIIENYKNDKEWTGYIHIICSEEDDCDFQINQIIFPFFKEVRE